MASLTETLLRLQNPATDFMRGSELARQAAQDKAQFAMRELEFNLRKKQEEERQKQIEAARQAEDFDNARKELFDYAKLRIDTTTGRGPGPEPVEFERKWQEILTRHPNLSARTMPLSPQEFTAMGDLALNNYMARQAKEQAEAAKTAAKANEPPKLHSVGGAGYIWDDATKSYKQVISPKATGGGRGGQKPQQFPNKYGFSDQEVRDAYHTYLLTPEAQSSVVAYGEPVPINDFVEALPEVVAKTPGLFLKKQQVTVSEQAVSDYMASIVNGKIPPPMEYVSEDGVVDYNAIRQAVYNGEIDVKGLSATGRTLITPPQGATPSGKKWRVVE